MKNLSLPFFLLATMVPLPVIVYNAIASPLQLLASDIAANVAQVCGVSVFRDGYILWLAHVSLGVEEACSGLNSLSALIVGSVLLRFFVAFRIQAALDAVPDQHSTCDCSQRFPGGCAQPSSPIIARSLRSAFTTCFPAGSFSSPASDASMELRCSYIVFLNVQGSPDAILDYCSATDLHTGSVQRDATAHAGLASAPARHDWCAN